MAIRIRDERFLDPAAYVESIADSVRARGGAILEGVTVDDIRHRSSGVTLADGHYDAVVLATGARLNALARHGVRRSSRRVAATPSPSRSTTCRAGPSTSLTNELPARPSATGSASPG